MSTAVASPSKVQIPWPGIAWFAALMIACYAPVLAFLVRQWNNDSDMGHGFFVPIVAGYIVWQRRAELEAIQPRPNWWGLAVVFYGALQLLVATLGTDLFLARTAFVITIIGGVWLLGGTEILRKLAFPLFLLFFMVPIPGVVYNQITFRLQILASKVAEQTLPLLNIPVMREGNILHLPNQTLSVVEACSGIRSLLTLTFMSLVYGYFFEKRAGVRAALFLSTIPIAIVANASRVTLTGVMSQFNPELAEGFFHESTGMVIWFVSLAILMVFHLSITRVPNWFRARRAAA
jgi:exosortase